MPVSLNPSAILSGQGIDVSSLVQQIIAEQSGELSVWEGQQTTFATQDGLLSGIENNLTNLQTAVAALADPTGELTAQAATSSNSAVLTATAENNAISSTHQIVVTNLATEGSLFTTPFAGGAKASFLATGQTGGDLQLQVGGASGVTHDILITPGSNDTLATLSSYINTQSALHNWGVSASVVTNSDGSGARLSLLSQSTGNAGALAITANNATGPLTTADLPDANTSILPTGQSTGDIKLQIGGSAGPVEDLAITQGANDTLTTLSNYINTQSTANNWGVTASVVNDAGGSHLQIQASATGSAGILAFTTNTTTLVANPNPTGLAFAAPVGGLNAAFTIDGAQFSSATNTVTGPIQGVTLNLLSQSTAGPVQLTIGPDQTQITSAVNNFISAYNTIISTINSQYVVDPTGTIPAPPLESDISLRSLQSSLLTDAGFAIGGNSGLVNLASMGINMNNDGTLTLGMTPVDPSGLTPGGQTFAQVLADNPVAVQNFFQNSSATGFANNFNTDLTNLTSPTQGPLNVDLTQNQAEQTDLTTTINNFETQITAQTTQLTSQYDAVNASLQEYPLLLQEITQTLGTLGSGTSGSGALVSSGPTLTSGL